MGATANLFPAMILGSGSAGQGITSDNVSPMNLIYIRKVGYGVRRIEDIGMGTPEGNLNSYVNDNAISSENNENMQMLQQLLEQILRNLTQ
jgi:hypothetical protein